MSVQFNDTTNYKGLVQLYEKEIGANLGDVSGDTTKLKEFTADVNLAYDEFLRLAFQYGGTWQYDDSNQTDYPFITTSLVDGQRDYAFTTDGSSNLILDIFRVFVKPSATSSTYVEIFPVDQQSDAGTEGFWDGSNTEGAPYRYDKTANGIFLDPIPSYSVSAGLKVFINREPSYFTSADTTKKPGVPGLFHEYFALKPALKYAYRNSLATAGSLQARVVELESRIREYFSFRERDTRKKLSMAPISFR